MMVQLTDEAGRKFYLSIDLIEKVTERQFRGGSAVYLTTGRWVECIESPEMVIKMVNERPDHGPKTN